MKARSAWWLVGATLCFLGCGTSGENVSGAAGPGNAGGAGGATGSHSGSTASTGSHSTSHASGSNGSTSSGGGMGGMGGAGAGTSSASTTTAASSSGATGGAGGAGGAMTGAGGATSSSAGGVSSSSASTGSGGGTCAVDADCDDDIACTHDACDQTTHACTHTADDVVCDDGVACNGVETCDAATGCVSGPAPSCDDGVACTDDFCDAATDACKHVVNDTKCTGGTFCAGGQRCDAQAGCVAGTPPDCDDGIACTMDVCDEALKRCDHFPNNAACADGNFCNGDEICDLSLGCRAGPPRDCSDPYTCTIDTCDEAQKKCVHTKNDAFCDDGVYCNGAERCAANGIAGTGCLPGPNVQCPDDGITCTTDVCVESSRSCEHIPNDVFCPAGQHCIVAQGGCALGSPCNTSAQCDDGDACNGTETCVAGLCAPGTPKNCDDGIQCTADTCSSISGQCVHTPVDTACDDGLRCNGVEKCDVTAGCITAIPAPNCDDGIACTFDSCVEPSGTCKHAPDDTVCDDGKLCNGQETCDPVLGCKPASQPYVCPDTGVACTSSVCDPVTNSCKTVTNNSACPCGQTCDAVRGCGNYCTVAHCQGHVYQCGDCLDNDGDCKIDSDDPECLGACDNTENSLYGGIPGQNNSPCKQDCYFDQDTGSGNDDCYWSHKCDPHEVPPAYSPEDNHCAYDPNANIAGTPKTCSQLFAAQSAQCASYCGPLTPNGCDCFGCCAIPGAPTTVWLGSENPPGTGSCNLNTLADPTKCKPCEQVTACLNPCDHCELCVGKTTLPPDCQVQTCSGGTTPCGQPGQAACAAGFFCITGCCQPTPQ